MQGPVNQIATVDLGTQSALYLFASRKNDGNIHFGRQRMKSVRLGQGLFRTQRISMEALNRALDAVKEFKTLAVEDGAQEIYLAGTRVFRGAANGQEAAAYLTERTGIEMVILDESEEARLGFLGVQTGQPDSNQPVVVVDIGGGSTELSMGTGETLHQSISIPQGAVTLTESWQSEGHEHTFVFPHPVDAAWKSHLHQADKVFAVAGTVTTLAASLLNQKTYNAGAIDGFLLKRSALARFMEEFSQISLPERRKRLAIAPERADILLAGCTILAGIMDLGDLNHLTVSSRGLRHGLAWQVLQSDTGIAQKTRLKNRKSVHHEQRNDNATL